MILGLGLMLADDFDEDKPPARLLSGQQLDGHCPVGQMNSIQFGHSRLSGSMRCQNGNDAPGRIFLKNLSFVLAYRLKPNNSSSGAGKTNISIGHERHDFVR